MFVSKSLNPNSEKDVQRSSKFIPAAAWINLFIHNTHINNSFLGGNNL